MDVNACNFDWTATEDDGSCTFAADGYDCDGNCLEIVTAIVDCWCSENETLTAWTEFDDETCTTWEMCACECINDQNNNSYLARVAIYVPRDTRMWINDQNDNPIKSPTCYKQDDHKMTINDQKMTIPEC